MNTLETIHLGGDMYGDDSHREAMCDPDYAEGQPQIKTMDLEAWEAGYEAGKAAGIAQGTLDGYDAGFKAGLDTGEANAAINAMFPKKQVAK